MPIRRGSFGGAVNLLPTVTIGATTDFTESRGVFNATVNGNLANTTVVFHYSTASNFSSYSSVNGSGSGTGSFSSSATVTGLTVNTTYYVRAVATSSIGAVTSGSVSFLTWHLISWSNGTPGTYYLTVPTVPGVNPAALVNSLVVGAGGGGAGGSTGSQGGGGGAGGWRYNTSGLAFNGTSGALTIVVGGGAGGSAVDAGNGGGGGSSYITGTNMPTFLAGGGEGGLFGTNPRGGNVGSGDNPAYTGGASLGATIFKSTVYFAGGGAGVNGNGGAAYESGGTYYSGNGGPGGTIAISFGAGGGGGFSNPPNGGQNGSGGGYGNGGHGGDGATGGSGAGGAVIFNYYGP